MQSSWQPFGANDSELSCDGLWSGVSRSDPHGPSLIAMLPKHLEDCEPTADSSTSATPHVKH